MTQAPKSFATHQVDILGAMAKTGIRQLSPGGKARAFCDILASKLATEGTDQYLNISQTLLPYATGTSLDMLGQVHGVDRIQPQESVVSSQDNNFRFYVRRGTFGSINAGQDIVIPAGTRISTADPNGAAYLSDSVTLPASAATMSFTARAVSSGAAGNAPTGVFTRHNFTNYVESPYGSLLVTNTYGIVGGRDREEDDNYRYRIHLKLSSKSGVNEASLRFELLQLPGIQDVVFKPAAGYFYVYLYGISPIVSTQILQSAQEILNEHAAYPIKGICLTPELVGISLATTIRLFPGTLPSEKAVIAGIAKAAAEEYLNNIALGDVLVINEIADRIRNSDGRIVDVGEPNRQISEIYIWRSRTDKTRYSRYLVSNYTPALGERVVVEDKQNAVSIAVTG